MQQITPHTYLRIGTYALAAAVFCLLILFLASTPLDPLIQGATLLFYLAAILAMGGILRSYYSSHREHSSEPPRSDTTGGKAGSATGEEAPPPATAQTLAPEELNKTFIVLLSKHDHTVRAIRKNLYGWNHTLDVVRSCAEASQHILNRMPEHGVAPRTILIVDALDLEMDPIHLPTLVTHETSRAAVKLIGIFSGLDATRMQRLKDAGYSVLLDTPVEKSLLFSAISTQEDQSTGEDNVVNLAHYRQQHGPQTRKHILLADQNTAERNRIAGLLRAAGHRVKTVENGEQALDSLEHRHFDLAVINLKLPIMNGTQVIKLHRFTTPHPQWVNFIVMTDETTPATLRLCRDLQIRACLFKPVPCEALLEMVDSAPVVAPPAPATIEHVRLAVKHRQETRFLHADLLDIKVLQALDQLDNDKEFVPHLISIFNRDSVVVLQGMDEATEYRDTKRFIELSNNLMDNAGQLGAFALYETCLSIQEMSRRELNESLCAKLAHLRELVGRTNLAFQHYLSEREDQRSDRS